MDVLPSSIVGICCLIIKRHTEFLTELRNKALFVASFGDRQPVRSSHYEVTKLADSKQMLTTTLKNAEAYKLNIINIKFNKN